MEELFSELLTKLQFFASGPGVLSIGAVTMLIFLLWEWRFALLGLLVIQLGVATLVVRIQGLPVQTAGVQILVIGLCVFMLSLAAQQMRARTHLLPPGGWLLRGMVLILLVVSWRLFDLNLAIPLLAPVVAQLFIWLALCSLLILSLSDAPFFTAIALLLWCIPMQAVVEVVAPGHSLFVLVGMMEVVLTLACSYLILVDLTPVARPVVAPTDITFPEPKVLTPALPAPARERLLTGPTVPTANRPTLPAEPTPDAPLVVRGSQ